MSDTELKLADTADAAVAAAREKYGDDYVKKTAQPKTSLPVIDDSTEEGRQILNLVNKMGSSKARKSTVAAQAAPLFPKAPANEPTPEPPRAGPPRPGAAGPQLERKLEPEEMEDVGKALKAAVMHRYVSSWICIFLCVFWLGFGLGQGPRIGLLQV